MGSIKENLLAAAAQREEVVEVGGQKIYVREVGALEFAEYGKLLKTDRVKATALLMTACVMDGPGGNQLLTVDEAVMLSKSARMSMPIVQKIMELSGFGDDAEKEPDAG